MSAAYDWNKLLPDFLGPLRQTHGALVASELEAGLRHLITLRASQINRCAFCVDMHYREALADGDTPERLAEYVNFFGERIVGLTGKTSDLRTLTQRYRTTFGHEEPDAEGDYAVTHSGAVYVFDREGNPRLLIRPEDLSAQAIRQDLVALLEESS
mgnify:CR=1 FL=1